MVGPLWIPTGVFRTSHRNYDQMSPEPDDNNLKLHELVDRQGKLAAKGKSVNFVLGNIVKTSARSGDVPEQKEIPMITLKHRWMRNRNVVVGSTIFSFNQDGIAKIQDIGNSSLDAAALVRQANGLVSVVEDTPKPAESKPEAAPRMKKPTPEAAAPEPQAEKSPEEAPKAEEEQPQAKPSKKRPPGKAK